MRFWASPIPLPSGLEQRLTAAGMVRFHGQQCRDRPVLLYDTPHALLFSPTDSLSVTSLHRWLIELRRNSDKGAHVASISRLSALTPEDLDRWVRRQVPLNQPKLLPAPDSMVALLTLTILEARPELLDAYLNLELNADLFGGTTDHDYAMRLRRAIQDADPAQLQMEFHSIRRDHQTATIALHSINRRLRTLQARHVRMQRRAERLRHLDGERRLRVAGLRARCRDLLAQLAAMKDACEASRESDVAHQQQLQQQLQQLHSELEHYYLQNHRYRWLCQQVQGEMRRAELLFLEVS